MCRKHGKHEADGADAAGNTGIILLSTCIRGSQMLQLSRVCRSVQTTGRQGSHHRIRSTQYGVLQVQETFSKRRYRPYSVCLISFM